MLLFDDLVTEEKLLELINTHSEGQVGQREVRRTFFREITLLVI
jgi:hypothetical protein